MGISHARYQQDLNAGKIKDAAYMVMCGIYGDLATMLMPQLGM